MKVATRLLTLIVALAVILLAAREGSHIYAKANADGHHHGNIPPGMHATKHLRPVFTSPKFYEQDPRNAVQKNEGVTVQLPKDDRVKNNDIELGGPILGTYQPSQH